MEMEAGYENDSRWKKARTAAEDVGIDSEKPDFFPPDIGRVKRRRLQRKWVRREMEDQIAGNENDPRRKKSRMAAAKAKAAEVRIESEKNDFFHGLPDDLVLFILSKISSSAASPSDLISVLVTCKRLNGLGLDPLVLSKASERLLALRAKNWSDSAHRFLKKCADARNLDACYILGMIRFYCLQSRASGASLMARAALGSHAEALYSLAVIQFNGSGGAKDEKDLRAGVTLCARAAFLGHVGALRELGHCLQDGLGVRRDVAEGRRFLIQANFRELLLASSSGLPSSSSSSSPAQARHPKTRYNPLLSDFGWSVPAPDPHPANRFLAEWMAARDPEDGMRMCSHAGCGRPETRRHEFRSCSVCGKVNYCSRACQALDWKIVHKDECFPVERWMIGAGEVAGAGGGLRG